MRKREAAEEGDLGAKARRARRIGAPNFTSSSALRRPMRQPPRELLPQTLARQKAPKRRLPRVTAQPLLAGQDPDGLLPGFDFGFSGHRLVSRARAGSMVVLFHSSYHSQTVTFLSNCIVTAERSGGGKAGEAQSKDPVASRLHTEWPSRHHVCSAALS